MSEPLEVAIQKALWAQLNAAPSLGTIAPPMVKYTPTAGASYLEARPVMRAPPEHPGLDHTDSDRHRGIFQVDVVVPDDGKGEAPGLRLAASVVDRFAIGTELTANGYKLRINTKPSIAAVVRDGVWWRFPVSIKYVLMTN
jgi:hypothetical protein